MKLLALAALLPVAAAAQDNPTIRTAARLAAEGKSDSARALVATVIAGARAGDPTYVEAIYWRARFWPTGDSAERDLRRVALDYPDSKYADRALLQLSQLALASGNAASALSLATRLRSDYPASDLRPRAAMWAGRAAFEVGEPRAACAYLDSARAESSADIEFANQIRFYQARCTPELLAAPPPPRADSAAAARPDSQRAAPAANPPAPSAAPAAAPAATPAPRFDVQVVAVRSRREARRVLAQLTRAHKDGHIVTGDDGLLRVRVGPFASQAAADSAARSLRRIVGGRPFTVRLP